MLPRRLVLWLVLAIAAAATVALWLLLPAPPSASWRALPPDAPRLAFWAIFPAIIGAIWKGLQVAGSITLKALAWSVKALWVFASATANGLKAVGRALALAGKQTWKFLRTTLAQSIVKGWKKFWSFVDRFRNWLEKSFKPVLKFLFKLRDRLMKFYTKWIRPVLDLIDIGRKTARVLGALGIDWAKALDRKLMEIQEAIDRPFRAVLAKVNEVIGIVNRVVTLDGLFQRLALIRSIERDVKYIHDVLTSSRDKPLTAEQRAQLKKDQEVKSARESAEELRQYLTTGSGPRAAFIDELAAQWRVSLSDQR